MSPRDKIKILLLVSGMISALSFITDPIARDLCKSIYTNCSSLFKGDIGVMVFLFSFAIFSLSVILLFTKEAIFKTWSKFALVYLPLAVILLAISPSSNADIYGLDRELVAWFASGLFFIISILIIAIKSWKLRE